MVTTELINLDIKQMADTESAIRYLEQEGYVVSNNNLMNSNYITPENAYHYYVVTEDEWNNMKMTQGYPNSTSGVIILGAVSESTSTLTFDNAMVVYYTSEDATNDINTKAQQMGDLCTAHGTYGTTGLLVGTSTVPTGDSPVLPNPVVELSNINLDLMASQGVEAYLSNNGYRSAYENGEQFISNAGNYEYHQITAEEVAEYFGDLLISGYNSVHLAKGNYYDTNNSKGQMAIILHYNDKDQAAESLNNIVEEYTGLATEGITMNILQQNYSGSEEYGYVAIFAIEVIMDTTSGGETEKTDIASFNFEEASKFETFSDYLLDCGYTEYPGTMDEFLRSGAGEYLFKMGVGSDFGAGDAPEAITKCEKFAPIMQIISQYEQRSAMYFKCSSKEDVAVAREYMMSQFSGTNAPECILDISNDTELVIGFYMKSSSGGEINTPMRSVPLRNLNFAKGGKYTIQVSAVNEYGEGPLSARTVVEINQYNVSHDNETVIISKDDGTDPSTILSCGSDVPYRFSVLDESKMLPEDIEISGADRYHYSRQSDNNRYGFLYIYKASSDVSISFGELPNYKAPATVNKFILQSPDGKIKEQFETELSSWRDFASETDGFECSNEIKYIINDVEYVVNELDANNGAYNSVKEYTTIRNGGVYYLITAKTLTFMKDGAVRKTVTTTQDTWETLWNDFNADEQNNIQADPIGQMGYGVGRTFYYIKDADNNFINQTDKIISGTYYIVDVELSKYRINNVENNYTAVEATAYPNMTWEYLAKQPYDDFTCDDNGVYASWRISSTTYGKGYVSYKDDEGNYIPVKPTDIVEAKDYYYRYPGGEVVE